MQLKYRIRYKKSNKILKEHFFIEYDGSVSAFNNEFNECIYLCDQDNYQVEVWTGLKDRNDREVYEGDKVKFTYYPGDFAYDFMDEEEAKANDEMRGREYVGTVVKSIVGNNLDICVGEPPAPTMWFPISYVQQSEIVE